MFWFTNWQRRILYNAALRCYDAMQCADVCFVFECTIVWLAREFDHTQAPKHRTGAMEGRLSVYLIVWFGPFLQILQSIGLRTRSPFPSSFHCTVSYRLCGMLLYRDLSPTQWMQQSGGGSVCVPVWWWSKKCVCVCVCLYDEISKSLCICCRVGEVIKLM